LTLRDRKNLFALSVGLTGTALVWMAGQLAPGQMLCVARETLLGFGLLLGIAARFWGWLIGRER